MKPLKSFAVFIAGVLAAFYLVNPGAGIFEIIPDNLPFVGNLDEAGATALLLACLRYFGLDLFSFFKPAPKRDEKVVDVESKRVP